MVIAFEPLHLHHCIIVRGDEGIGWMEPTSDASASRDTSDSVLLAK